MRNRVRPDRLTVYREDEGRKLNEPVQGPAGVGPHDLLRVHKWMIQ
jgi:hypothetical protein